MVLEGKEGEEVGVRARWVEVWGRLVWIWLVQIITGRKLGRDDGSGGGVWSGSTARGRWDCIEGL
jgi:hypothetical protein